MDEVNESTQRNLTEAIEAAAPVAQLFCDHTSAEEWDDLPREVRVEWRYFTSRILEAAAPWIEKDMRRRAELRVSS